VRNKGSPLFSHQVVAKRQKDRSDKAGGTRLRVGGTRACGSRGQSGALRRCSRPGMRNAGYNAGHTLVETMIASSISIIVLAGFFSTIGVFQTGSSNLSLLLERDTNLWLAPLLLSRWIIPAGNNRWDQAWSGVTMDTDRIELKSDIDGSGGFPDSKLSSSFEALALRSSNSNLRVQSNRGSFQPLIKNIVDFKVASKESGLLSIRLKAITDRPLSRTQEDLPESTELLFFLRNYRANLFPENP